MKSPTQTIFVKQIKLESFNILVSEMRVRGRKERIVYLINNLCLSRSFFVNYTYSRLTYIHRWFGDVTFGGHQRVFEYTRLFIDGGYTE